MGVYHISGVGFRPGAVTVPLTAVYTLQIAQALGIEEAKEFFKYSSEAEKKGSYEMTKGIPEVLVVFTSRDVIEGRKKLEYKSNWFSLSGGSEEKVEKPIVKYLKKLFRHIEKNFNLEFCLKKFYLVKVDHQNFDDCFEKIGVILRALKDKEVWGNMIGGTNQINLAMLTAGAYTATISSITICFRMMWL